MFRFIKSLFGGTRSAEFVSKSSSPAAVAVEIPPAPSAFLPCPPSRTANSGRELCLEIPMQPIVDRLDPSLRSKMTRPLHRSEILKLPVNAALDQLPHGAVRIPFSQLKAGAGPGLFVSGSDFDASLVEVPLAEIVSRLNPAQLRRRPDQTRLSPSEDLPAVFVPRGAPHAPRPEAQAQVKPEMNVMDELTSSRIMAEAASAAPISRVRPLSVKPPLPPIENRPAPLTVSHLNSRLSASATPVSGRTPSGSGKPAAEPIKVPLACLARNWPEPMRREVMATYMSASVNLPFSEVEAAMKRGRAVFSWKQIRLWLSPAPPVPLTEHDTASVELPLPVLAPLFLARLSGTASPKKVAAAEEIPNVFTARKPAEKKPVPSENSAGAGKESRNGTAPTQPAKPPLQTEGHHDNEPIRLHPLPGKEPEPAARAAFTPADVVRRACLLSGVAGAVLTTLDGLVIATQLPCQLSAETAAGLLPELYRRLANYTRELKLGEPSHVELLIGSTPLQIFKMHSAYFAVLGKPAEPLPKLQLSGLAGQLSQRTNQG